VVGKSLILLGLVGIGAITGYEAASWLQIVPESYRQYFVRRVLFVFASNPALGVAPVLLSGVACWIAGARRAVRE